MLKIGRPPKLHPDEADSIAKLLFYKGTKGVAAQYKCTTMAVLQFKNRYLACWRPPGTGKWLKKYFVYKDGRIWSIATFAFLKPGTDRYGYVLVSLGRGKHIRLHRLLMLLFKRPPKPKEMGRHFDGDKSNNKLSNLRWGTAKQNQRDRIRHGTANQGIRHGHAKLTDRIVVILRKRYAKGEIDIARRYAKRHGMTVTSIMNAIKKKTWKHI